MRACEQAAQKPWTMLFNTLSIISTPFLVMAVVLQSSSVLAADITCKGTFSFRSTLNYYTVYLIEFGIQAILGDCCSAVNGVKTWSDGCFNNQGIEDCLNWDGTYTATVKEECGCFTGAEASDSSTWILYIAGKGKQ